VMSYTERARRRGAIAFLEFEAEMIKLGFVEQPAQGGMLHEYTHPAAPKQRFTMAPGEGYAKALERLRCELEAARGGHDAGAATTRE
jgi:hypothetical protein